MAEKNPSQVQQAAVTSWTQALEETQKAQARWFEQSTRAIDEMASMMKAGLKYQSDLANDFRRLALESTKTWS